MMTESYAIENKEQGNLNNKKPLAIYVSTTKYTHVTYLKP